jgi:hypothetical protein
MFGSQVFVPFLIQVSNKILLRTSFVLLLLFFFHMQRSENFVSLYEIVEEKNNVIQVNFANFVNFENILLYIKPQFSSCYYLG